VRQCEHDGVVPGQGLRGGRLEDAVGERHQVWLERSQWLAGVATGRHRADLGIGMTEQQT
jgi:hypothetical protein